MNYDITIIGSGPGGYVAAIRAAQLGASVALIEKDKLGGTCLNKGCIPTKAMLASVHLLENIKHSESFGIDVENVGFNITRIYDRKQKIVDQMRKGLEQLLRSYSQITIFTGDASIVSSTKILVRGKEEYEIDTKNIIIATGSSCASLYGVEIDHNKIINSDDALELSTLPEKMLIIGGGAIGVEWCRIFSALDVDVTLVEMLPRIAPACDEDLSNLALKLLKKNKVKFKLGVRVDNIQLQGEKVDISLSDGDVILSLIHI